MSDFEPGVAQPEDNMSREIREAMAHEAAADALEMSMLGQTTPVEPEGVYEYALQNKWTKQNWVGTTFRSKDDALQVLAQRDQPGDWDLVRRVKATDWEAI